MQPKFKYLPQNYSYNPHLFSTGLITLHRSRKYRARLLLDMGQLASSSRIRGKAVAGTVSSTYSTAQHRCARAHMDGWMRRWLMWTREETHNGRQCCGALITKQDTAIPSVEASVPVTYLEGKRSFLADGNTIPCSRSKCHRWWCVTHNLLSINRGMHSTSTAPAQTGNNYLTFQMIFYILNQRS